MAEVNPIYVTLDNLGRAMQKYDVNFRMYTDDKIKGYIRAITFDPENRLLKFYTIPAPIPEGTIPYLQVEIPPEASELDALYNISMETPVVPDTGKFKTHIIYQGTGDNKTEIGRINLEYDTVVKSGVVVEATPQEPIVVGEQTFTSGKFLKLTINNSELPVYISLEDMGVEYIGSDGINISANAEISIEIDSSNANGLEVTASGLGLNVATSSTAGAMSAEDKGKLDSIVVATEAQIRALFE